MYKKINNQKKITFFLKKKNYQDKKCLKSNGKKDFVQSVFPLILKEN